MNVLDVHYNFSVLIKSCQLGALHPPTSLSLGIAIRPIEHAKNPILRFYIQESLMQRAGLYIGDHMIALLSDDATHIKVKPDPNGYKLYAAANNDGCVDFEDAADGTQYTGRFNVRLTDDVMEKYKFEDKCTTFVEPVSIRKGKYIIAPLDDLPIWPVKR